MDQTEVRDAALEVLSHLEEIAGKGQTEFACSSFPSMKLIADYANAMLSTEPLSLDVLRRELGEPTSADKTMTRHFVRWKVCGALVIRNELSGLTSILVLGKRIQTAGQLRRILSVIRETAAGGEGE